MKKYEQCTSKNKSHSLFRIMEGDKDAYRDEAQKILRLYHYESFVIFFDCLKVFDMQLSKTTEIIKVDKGIFNHVCILYIVRWRC